MCTPNTFLPTESSNLLNSVFKGVGVANTIASTLSDYKTYKTNAAYRTQITLNNAKNAQNEANRQRQLGIEQSRVQKIKGIQEANLLKAKNSASGLDLMSQTNKYAYQDAYNMANLNALSTKKEYENQAINYFNQANSYLNQAYQSNKQYNQTIFDYSLNALGKFNQVANQWYENREEVML